MLRAVVLALISISALFAQQSGNSQPLYHRVLARVPMVGKGTPNDPKRPMFVPLPSDRKSGDRSGIITFQFQMSDDGNTALVELVAADRSALNAILSSNDARVKTFERGKAPSAAVEADFRQFKKNFSLDTFRPVRVQ